MTLRQSGTKITASHRRHSEADDSQGHSGRSGAGRDFAARSDPRQDQEPASRTSCDRGRRHEGSTERQEDLRQVQGRAPQGRGARALREPSPQAASGLKEETEHHGTYRRRRPSRSQARLDLAAVHLRHRSEDRARRSARRPRSPTNKMTDTLDENELQAHPRGARRELQGRRRPAPRHPDEHQAPDGPRLLPRPASPPRPAGARSAHAHQRAHAQGPAQGPAWPSKPSGLHRPGDRKHGEVRQAAAPRQRRRARPRKGGAKKKAKKNVVDRHRAHPVDVQQHDRHDHRPAGQRGRLVELGRARLQGLAQEHAVRRAARRRGRRAQGGRSTACARSRSS